MKKLFAIAALSAATIPAFAGDIYIAGSVGQSDFNAKQSDWDNDLRSLGLTGLSSNMDKTDLAYKLQAGYQFNPYLAVEGGYVDLGKLKYSASFSGGNVTEDLKAKGWTIAAVGILPINEAFSLFGKVGIINAEVKAKATATIRGRSATFSDSTTNWKPMVGIGASYNFNKQIGIRVEYERFNDLGDDSTGKGDVDLVSAGVVFKF